MDVTRWLAFGDRQLQNQVYLIVHPAGLIATVVLMIAPAWIGAWYRGRSGLTIAVLLQVLAIAVSLGAWLYQIQGSDQDFSGEMTTFAYRIALIQFGIVILMAIGATFWLRRRHGREF